MRTPLARGLAVAFVTALATAMLMSIYTERVLGGDLDRHVLAAEMFGVPDAVARHGFRPFYEGKHETGWDGQFYYYIANDPLARRDTARHVDSDAYRYQRVGLPLIAWAASRLALSDWVSPTLYYGVNLATVLIAAWVGGAWFARRGSGAWPILLWSLSFGVQVTLMNGLPDAAADALLILALVCHFQGRRAAYALCAALAALSREAYVLFPVVIAAYDCAVAARFQTAKWGSGEDRRTVARATLTWLARRAWVPAIPLLAFGGWQLYVRHHFHIAPSAQATAILGPPFKAWFGILFESLTRSHPLYGPGIGTTREIVGLLLFMVVLLASALLAWTAWRRAERASAVEPVAAATLLLIALYACFGSTVMEHYTGYMKAAGLFFLVAPFLWMGIGRAPRLAMALLLIAVDGYFLGYLWLDRIDVAEAGYDRYQKASQVTETAPRACLRSYGAKVALVGVEELEGHGLLARLDATRRTLFRVAVTNETPEPFAATTSKGSVNVSYHWLTADGKTVAKDGIRTFMPDGLAPGATAEAAVVVEYPDPGHYLLRLTLVQEGCAWFYSADPSSKLDLDFVVR